MKKIWLSMPLFAMIWSCKPDSPQKDPEPEKTLSYDDFKGYFGGRNMERIEFHSDSIPSTEGLTEIKPGDSLLLSYLPEPLFSNGGYAFASAGKENANTDLFVVLMKADLLGPVFLKFTKEGKLVDHLIGYESPGYDEGFESHESCGIDSTGKLFFRDQVKTWDPQDSAKSYREQTITRIYDPLAPLRFEKQISKH